jgi:uncharacterized membrane protein
MMALMCVIGGLFIGGLLLAGLILVGGALLLRSRSVYGTRATRVLHILDERLARGEIDQDDYQERRALLQESGRLNSLKGS